MEYSDKDNILFDSFDFNNNINKFSKRKRNTYSFEFNEFKQESKKLKGLNKIEKKKLLNSISLKENLLIFYKLYFDIKIPRNLKFNYQGCDSGFLSYYSKRDEILRQNYSSSFNVSGLVDKNYINLDKSSTDKNKKNIFRKYSFDDLKNFKNNLEFCIDNKDKTKDNYNDNEKEKILIQEKLIVDKNNDNNCSIINNSIESESKKFLKEGNDYLNYTNIN